MGRVPPAASTFLQKSLRTAIVVVHRQQPNIPRTGLALEYSEMELYLRALDKICFIACVLRDMEIQIFRVLGRANESESALVEIVDCPEHFFPSLFQKWMGHGAKARWPRTTGFRFGNLYAVADSASAMAPSFTAVSTTACLNASLLTKDCNRWIPSSSWIIAGEIRFTNAVSPISPCTATTPDSFSSIIMFSCMFLLVFP